jgi:hypothetical protein
LDFLYNQGLINFSFNRERLLTGMTGGHPPTPPALADFSDPLFWSSAVPARSVVAMANEPQPAVGKKVPAIRFAALA